MCMNEYVCMCVCVIILMSAFPCLYESIECMFRQIWPNALSVADYLSFPSGLIISLSIKQVTTQTNFIHRTGSKQRCMRPRLTKVLHIKKARHAFVTDCKQMTSSGSLLFINQSKQGKYKSRRTHACTHIHTKPFSLPNTLIRLWLSQMYSKTLA